MSNNCPKPVISISQRNNTTTDKDGYNLSFRVTNVSSYTSIKVLDKNQNPLNFSYNVSTKNGSVYMPLVEGPNNINIIAQNNCGSANKSFNINRSKCQPPRISFSGSKNKTTKNSTYTTYFYVKGVEDMSQISLKDGNGMPLYFTFTKSNKRVKANLSLAPGIQSYTVTATNNCGVQTESFEINYNDCKNPVVSFINPANITVYDYPAWGLLGPANFQGNLAGKSVHLNIHISATNKIKGSYYYKARWGSLVLSGTMNPDKSFQMEERDQNGKLTGTFNGQFNADFSVAFGTWNRPGSSSKLNFQFSRSIENDPWSFVTSKNITLNFKATNVVKTSHITIYNNQIRLNAPFDFDLATGQGSVTLPLETGKNYFRIRATNSCDTDLQNFVITYNPVVVSNTQPDCNTPVVQMINPITSSSIQNTSVIQIKANVFNVTKQQITIKVNNTERAFSYMNNEITANLTLREGINSISLNTINACGTVSDQFTVNY